MDLHSKTWGRIGLAALILIWSMAVTSAGFAKTLEETGSDLDPSSLAQRIVSLVPSASEIIVEIGAGDRLIGITYHDATLNGADHRSILGGFFSPSLAHVRNLNPDLVIVSPLQQEIIEYCTTSGIPLFIYETRGLEDAWVLMERLGKRIGRQDAARELIRTNKDELARIRAKLAKSGAVPKRVIRLMGRDKVMTPGTGSFQNDMIRAAGGIAPDFGKPGKIVEVSLEEWQAFDPQVIYGCDPDRAAADRFFSRPGWKDVSAVKNHQIYYLPCDLTCRASARISAFLAGLSSMVYTAEFADDTAFVYPLGKIKERPLAWDSSWNPAYVDKTAIVYTHIYDFENKTLVMDLKRPMTILSTLEGWRDNITTVANHYSPPPTWMPGHADGIDHIRLSILTAIGRDRENTALLMTGADMDHVIVKTSSFKQMSVTALVTAGVVSNALRMAEDAGDWYEPGTINVILVTNMKLSHRAMSRAIISATEAKSAALQDLDIRSAYTGRINMATGTGTDNVMVVQGEGHPIDNAGGHSKMGELIARSVYAGVKEAIAGQNGIVSGRHLIQRLEERKIDIYQMTSGAQCNCQEKKKSFSTMVEQLLLNPEYAGFLESALGISDAYEKGQVRDLSSFDLWCARMAQKISGREEIMVEDLVRDKNIPLVVRKALNAVMTGARIRTGQEE